MTVSWLKKGDEAKKLEEQAAAEAAARKEEMGKLWRFWLEKGETGEITFVDGMLDKQYNALNPPRFYEHSLFMNNKVSQYICPEKTDPGSGQKCPLCAGGNRASLVAVFTVIDHRPYKTKNDVIIKDSRKLFVCTGKTLEALNATAIALKGNGLAGRRFSVTRGKTEQAIRVGETFVALDKEPLDELKVKYIRTFERTKDGKKEKVTENAFTVADYEKEFVYRNADELAKLGFGNPAQASSMPTEEAPPSTGEEPNYDGVL